jgi:hypothetical protein
MTERLRVQRERDFSPHHVLLGVAYNALEDAEKKRPGYFNYELACITFSALALEALGNAFGAKFIPRWNDFESASPIAKLRLICQRFDIEPDFGKEPWATTLWLVRFRNKVAHAKPEFIREDKIITREEYDKLRSQYPEAKLETEISLQNAQRAFNCVHDIHIMLCERIPPEQIGGLIADGWSSQAGLYQ